MDLKEAGLISGLVLLVSGLFTALFFMGFPSAAIFFGLIGVPAVFLGYTRYRVKETKSSMDALDEIQGSKLDQLLGRLKRLWNRLARFQERYFWPLEEVQGDLELYANQLEPYATVSIENEQLFYEVTEEEVPSATWTEERERELEALEEDLSQAFAEHLSDWTANLDDELSLLQESGRFDAWKLERPEPPEEPASLSDVESRYKNYLEEAEETLERWHKETGETLRSVEERKGINVEPVWEDHEMVRDALDRRDLPFAASLLQKVTDRMDEHLAGEFSDESSELQAAISQIQRLDLEDIVGHESWQRIYELDQQAQQLESSAQLLEISELKSDLRDAMEDIQQAVIKEVEEATSTQENQELPEELVDDRDHTEIVQSLPPLHEDLGDIVTRWVETMDELAGIARTRSKLAEAIELYPRIETDIEEVLEEKGRATEADLKVKDADPFFRIYSAQHSERCDFDEDQGRLTLKEEER